MPAAVYYLYIQMYGTTALNVGLLFDASNWKYWVLPVCSMSLGNVAFYAMWLRRYMAVSYTHLLEAHRCPHPGGSGVLSERFR